MIQLIRMAAALTALALPAGAFGAGKPDSGVPAERLARITKGVNLGGFRYRPDLVITEDLVAKLQAAGFRHVRLPIQPDLLYDNAAPGTLRPDGLRKVDAMVDLLLKHNLGVILDMHDPDKRLWNDDAYAGRFATYWEALARHMSNRSPEMVFFEVANEPLSDSPEHWNAVQGKLLAAMRRGAPKHTLIATENMQVAPGQWDQWKALQTLPIYPDRNIVYNFHEYNPFPFTHQGATWAGEWVKDLRDVPYPSSPEAVAPLLPKAGMLGATVLENYGRERWDVKRVREEIDRYANWAKEHKVPITCNEFGVYKAFSPSADRNRWLKDARTTLEADHIGWTLWDDGGGFGVTSYQNDKWSLDQDALRALGLRASL